MSISFQPVLHDWWDDETDMKYVEKLVRSVVADGLLSGTCKFTHTVYIEGMSISFQPVLHDWCNVKPWDDEMTNN